MSKIVTNSAVQNLIPLFFRPLRLILPSERLRHARIVLLKLTHFPFVAAIWAYEHGSSYFAGRLKGRDSRVSSMGGPETSTGARRPYLRWTLNSPRPLAAATGVQASLDGIVPGRSPTRNRHDTATGPSESEAQMRSLVVKLSSQVEQLTAMIAELQGQQSTGFADGE